MLIYKKFTVIACIAFSLFLILSYYNAYPLPYFFKRLFELSFILLFFNSLAATGRALMGFKPLNMAFAFGIGTGVYIAFTFFMGLAGLYYPAIFYMALISPSVLLYKQSPLFEIITTLKNFKLEVDFLKAIVLSVITISFLLTFIASFAPPTLFDSLTYHLALPQLYTINKKIFNVEYNAYFHFPQNLEMIYTFLLLIGDEILPNIFSFTVYALTTICIFNFSKNHINRLSGIASIFIFSTMPAVMLLSSNSYTEALLAFYTFLSLYSFIGYMLENKTQYLILSGIFAGLACGTKYTGIATVISITILLLFTKPEKILHFNLLALIIFAPWCIKNAINTGNPVFPFFYSLLGFRNINWSSENAHKYFTSLTGYMNRNPLKELINLPLSISIPEIKGGIDIIGSFGWMIFVLAVIIFLCMRIVYNYGLPPALKPVAYFSIIYFLIWFITKPVLRFLYPVIPAVSIITGHLIVEVIKKATAAMKAILIFIIALITISNFYIYFLFESYRAPFGVATGLETEENYLTNRIKFSPYEVFKFINKNLKDKDKIFFIGEGRGFYCKRNFITVHHVENPVTNWANNSNSHIELIKKFKDKGITHILYNKNIADITSPFSDFNFTPKGEKNFYDMISNLRLLYSSNNVYLYLIN